MTFIYIIIGIIVAATFYVTLANRKKVKQTYTKPAADDSLKLLDLNTTTLADRQRYYGRGFLLQKQFDELQRRAEAAGDIITLEAIRLRTYNGPLPPLAESQAPCLQYFCIKDKGYHTSVWPKGQSVGSYLEFPIAGVTYGEHVDDYLGEFSATLEADPSNPYDPQAIKIVSHEGARIGYVPKNQTQHVRDFTQLPCTCYCYIGLNDGMYFTDCYIVSI